MSTPPQQQQTQSDKTTKDKRRLSRIWSKVKTAFKDKDDQAATSSAQPSTSTPQKDPPQPGSDKQAPVDQAGVQVTTPTPAQPSNKAVESTSGRRPPGNVDADVRLQKIKAALEKYDYLLNEDGEVPITITDYRGTREMHERVQKNIRMRVKYTCHQCQTVYGSVKICISCNHKRCPECVRYPPKKKGKPEDNKQEPGKAGTQGKGGGGQPGEADTQCACHECRTGFEIGTAECPNCHHKICSSCLKKPELSIAIEPGSSGAGDTGGKKDTSTATTAATATATTTTSTTTTTTATAS